MSRLWLTALLLFPVIGSGQVTSRGHVGLETRVFQPDDDDATEDYGLGLSTRVDFAHRHRPFREQVRLFARIDMLDSERDIVIVEEAWFGARTKWFRTRLGAQILDWTATEAFHPADVMNSRNLDSKLENAEKIGEPMYFLGIKLFDGEISGYYMPLRMNVVLPGPSSRMSFLRSSPVPIGEPLWVDRSGEISGERLGHQWAATISQTIGPVDLAVQVLQHNDRTQPTTLLDTSDPTSPVGHALYHQVTHVGLTGVWADEYLSVKIEGAYRMFGDVRLAPQYIVPLGPLVPGDHLQLALGLESGWEWDSGHDSTILLEGQVVLGPDKAERQRLSPFQADVLLGYRHAFNDIDSKELLIGVIIDLESWPQIIGNVNYKQRLSDTWSLEAALRVVHAPKDDDSAPPTGLQSLHESSSLSLNLRRYF